MFHVAPREVELALERLVVGHRDRTADEALRDVRAARRGGRAECGRIHRDLPPAEKGEPVGGEHFGDHRPGALARPRFGGEEEHPDRKGRLRREDEIELRGDAAKEGRRELQQQPGPVAREVGPRAPAVRHPRQRLEGERHHLVRAHPVALGNEARAARITRGEGRTGLERGRVQGAAHRAMIVGAARSAGAPVGSRRHGRPVEVKVVASMVLPGGWGAQGHLGPYARRRRTVPRGGVRWSAGADAADARPAGRRAPPPARARPVRDRSSPARRARLGVAPAATGAAPPPPARAIAPHHPAGPVDSCLRPGGPHASSHRTASIDCAPVAPSGSPLFLMLLRHILMECQPADGRTLGQWLAALRRFAPCDA